GANDGGNPGRTENGRNRGRASEGGRGFRVAADRQGDDLSNDRARGGDRRARRQAARSAGLQKDVSGWSVAEDCEPRRISAKRRGGSGEISGSGIARVARTVERARA